MCYMLAHLNEPLMNIHIHYSIFSTRARSAFVLKNVFVCVIKNAGVINVQNYFARTHLTYYAYNHFLRQSALFPSTCLPGVSDERYRYGALPMVARLVMEGLEAEKLTFITGTPSCVASKFIFKHKVMDWLALKGHNNFPLMGGTSFRKCKCVL